MEKIKKKQKGLTPMDAALRYLGYRSRTVRETERHLDEKQFGEYEIMQVVERLKDLGLLDDRKYAEDFVQSSLRTKPSSKRILRMKLKEHEVPQDIIEDVLNGLPEETEKSGALEVAEKYSNIYAQLPSEERSKIVMRRLLSRGYGYSVAKEALERLALDTDDLDYTE